VLFNNCTIFCRGLEAFYIALGHVNPFGNYYHYYYNHYCIQPDRTVSVECLIKGCQVFSKGPDCPEIEKTVRVVSDNFTRSQSEEVNCQILRFHRYIVNKIIESNK